MNLSQSYAFISWAIHRDEKLVSAGRRWIAGAKVGGHQTIGIADASNRDGKGNGVSRTTTEHRAPIQCSNPHAFKCQGWAVKQIDAEIIGPVRLRIAPQRHFGVIAYPSGLARLMLQGIENVTSRGVAGFGHGNALKEWAGTGYAARKCEVADYPAIRNLIIECKRISLIMTRTT